jgi:tRNA(Ile)-lysidine synthase
MLSELIKILQDECQIAFEQPTLVAVSGGADSLCLADFMHQNGYSLVVAHFDHKLRPESSSEANFVKEFAHKRGLQFVLGEEKVSARVKEGITSIEEAARNARYDFLFQCAEEIHAQAVVVGHTADDQVETFLMHLLRGAGLDGLSGMPHRWLPNTWHDRIPLVRPLLVVWREETLAYCQQRGLEPVVDPTNLDRSYFRNRLRLELIPYLETFNPSARKLIWQTARVLRGDRESINQIIDHAWSRVLAASGENYVAVDADLCSAYPLAIQRHLIRRAIAHLRPGLRDISFEAVERAVGQIQETKPYAEVDLIAGLKMVSEDGRLWIAEWDVVLPVEDWPQVNAEPVMLEIGSAVDLYHGWQLAAELVEVESTPPQTIDRDVNQAYLDLERIEMPLVVRARRQGERIQLSGMQGRSQKLADFMINHKIPRRARERWPLVSSGDQIVWVVGYRAAHFCQITNQTRQVLKLELRQGMIGKK